MRVDEIVKGGVLGGVGSTEVKGPSLTAVAPLLKSADGVLLDNGLKLGEEHGATHAKDVVGGELVGSLGTVLEHEADAGVRTAVLLEQFQDHGGAVVDKSAEGLEVLVNKTGETKELVESVVRTGEQVEKGLLGNKSLVQVSVHGSEQGLGTNGGVGVGRVVVEAGGVEVLEVSNLVKSILANKISKCAVVDTVDVNVVKDRVCVLVVELGLGHTAANDRGEVLVKVKSRLVEVEELGALVVKVGTVKQSGAGLVALDPNGVGGVLVDSLGDNVLETVQRRAQLTTIGKAVRKRNELGLTDASLFRVQGANRRVKALEEGVLGVLDNIRVGSLGGKLGLVVGNVEALNLELALGVNVSVMVEFARVEKLGRTKGGEGGGGLGQSVTVTVEDERAEDGVGIGVTGHGKDSQSGRNGKLHDWYLVSW